MARKIVTLQTRRGNSSDFDATKMLSGEVATVEDTEQAYISFADGTAEELALKRDINNGGGNVEIPDTLPNPQALTFTGAVNASYDGSEAVTVNIPSGGGGGTGNYNHALLINRDAANQHPISAITGLSEQLWRTGVNLLHNADWGYSLVNQRGHSGAVSNAYCIDRWIGNGSATPVAGQYVTLTEGTSMTQRLEIIPAAIAGKRCTFSIELSDGEIASGAIEFPSNTAGSGLAEIFEVSTFSVALGFAAGDYVINGVSCSSVPYITIYFDHASSVRRVFLGLGAVSHMQITPPQNYAQNLAICQRYLLVLGEKNSTVMAGYAVCVHNNYNGGTLSNALLPAPAKMRIDTLTVTVSGTINLRKGTEDLDVTIPRASQVGGVTIYASVTGAPDTLAKNDLTTLKIPPGSKIVFSTEL